MIKGNHADRINTQEAANEEGAMHTQLTRPGWSMNDKFL